MFARSRREAFKYLIRAADHSTRTIRASDLLTTQMIQTYLAGAAASVAKDGVAPELGQDDLLRERQH